MIGHAAVVETYEPGVAGGVTGVGGRRPVVKRLDIRKRVARWKGRI